LCDLRKGIHYSDAVCVGSRILGRCQPTGSKFAEEVALQCSVARSPFSEADRTRGQHVTPNHSTHDNAKLGLPESSSIAPLRIITLEENR